MRNENAIAEELGAWNVAKYYLPLRYLRDSVLSKRLSILTPLVFHRKKVEKKDLVYVVFWYFFPQKVSDRKAPINSRPTLKHWHEPYFFVFHVTYLFRSHDSYNIVPMRILCAPNNIFVRTGKEIFTLNFHVPHINWRTVRFYTKKFI